MTAITSESSKLPRTPKESLLTQALPTFFPLQLIQMILSYLPIDYSSTNHRKRIYTRAINSDLSGIPDTHFYFHSFDKEAHRGEIIHFISNYPRGGTLHVHAIVAKNGIALEPQRYCSPMTPIPDWPQGVIARIQHLKDSFHFTIKVEDGEYKTHTLVKTGTTDRSGSHLLRAGDSALCATLELEDGVQYPARWNTPLTPYPIRVDENFYPHSSFLHGDFFFVAGTGVKGVQIRFPLCAVYSKSNKVQVASLRPQENIPIHSATCTGKAISLFANDDVVAMSWSLYDEHIVCTVWQMHTWKPINRIKTENNGTQPQCITIENGTVAIASENATTTFIEYFDFH